MASSTEVFRERNIMRCKADFRNVWYDFFAVMLLIGPFTNVILGDATRVYVNKLTPIPSPAPLLADYPDYVEPIRFTNRFEAPTLVDDAEPDIAVRAWRFSYNARAIIEIPNRLRGSATALIMVHPWGIDDGNGWKTPEPAGVCDFGWPERNQYAAGHTKKVIAPLLRSLRPKVKFVMYSLPGGEDPIRKLAYRSMLSTPTPQERELGQQQLKKKLAAFPYQAEDIPKNLTFRSPTVVIDYFQQFAGIDAGVRYNGKGFWDLPIPICDCVDAQPTDVVIYDADGYAKLRDFLKRNGVRNVLLVGYCTDMCYCETTAGHKNLGQDFNVFLVGDATLATYPANETPRFATNASISYAALNRLITQVSWIQPINKGAPANSVNQRGSAP